MESSREDQIMELFREMKNRYIELETDRIAETTLDYDVDIKLMNDEVDSWTARMTSLVYGKGADTDATE